MILTGLAVFLFGTAVTAGPLAEISISKHLSSDELTEYYPRSSGSPFISNFIQKGTNVFFKPQFMMSAAQMPPQVQTMIAAIEKDDCKTTLPMGPISMLMEEPLRVVEQEIVAASKPIIKEVIEINPVEYNQYVKPSIELTPALPPVLEIHGLEKMPIVEDSVELVLPCPPEVKEHVVIPEAPVLSPYVPHVPVSVVIETEKPKDVVHEVVISPVPASPMLIEEILMSQVLENEILEPVVIPNAPVLPPLKMPELPVVIEELDMVPCPPSEVHILPPFIPEVIVSPPKPILIEEKPMIIPEAPVLPPLVLPELPVTVEVEEKVVPCDIVEVVEPMVVPQAPVLPPLVLPELPVKVEVEEKVVPCDTVEVVEPMVIPEAPVLTPYVPIEKPTPVLVEEPVTFEILKPVAIPSAPVLPPLEMPKAPLIIEESVAPCPSENKFEHPNVFIESRPIVMPIPEYPQLSISNTYVSKPIVMASAPEFLVSYFPVVTEKLMKEEPASCVHDIVVERILPKLEKSFMPKAAKVPVSAYLERPRYALF